MWRAWECDQLPNLVDSFEREPDGGAPTGLLICQRESLTSVVKPTSA
jgi:hypothetical protein